MCGLLVRDLLPSFPCQAELCSVLWNSRLALGEELVCVGGKGRKGGVAVV